MITRDSDITRLLDRLQKQGFISRERQTSDRRIILTRIAADGLELLTHLDRPVSELHRKQFAKVKVLEQLIKSLTSLPHTAP